MSRSDIIEENMGTIKRVVLGYADGSDPDRWDDLFGAAMEGAAYALSNFDAEKGKIRDHIRRGARNYVINQLRKMKRWDKEISIQDNNHDFARFRSFHPPGTDGTFDDQMFFTEEICTDEVYGNSPLWIEPTLSPEEETIRNEELEIARAKVAELIPDLNERELYVLWNHIIADEPETMREIGDQFKCSKDSILRDVKRVKKMLEIKED